MHGDGQNRLRLTGSPIEPRQFATDDNVGIKRIGDDATVFLCRDRLPVTKRDLAIIAATCDSD
ncbi:MAG: hypothetical protein ACRD3W_02440, partial [Terriglobales bacterium]